VDRDRDLLTHREPGVRHSEQRSGGAHGSQLNWEHLLSAGSNGGAVVRATSPGALMTVWDRVTQPIAPRRRHEAAAIATRGAALGNSAPWFMSERLRSFRRAEHAARRTHGRAPHRYRSAEERARIPISSRYTAGRELDCAEERGRSSDD